MARLRGLVPGVVVTAGTATCSTPSLTDDYPGAATDLKKAIGIYRDLGSRGNEAWALNFYAAVIADSGDRVTARLAEIGAC